MKPIVNFFTRFVAAGACLMASGLSPVAATIINFDGLVDNDITNDYTGLTFNAPFPGTGPVRTWEAPFPDTASNVLGLSGQNNFFAFNQNEGVINIIFAQAQSSVSIRAAFIVATDSFLGIGGLPYMSVYSSDVISSSTLIGLDQWDIAGDPCLTGNFCQSGWDTLSYVSSANDIKAIQLSGFVNPNGPSRRAMFDTLTYERSGGNGGGGGTVPEPTTLALMGLGLSALNIRRRQAA